MTEERNMQRFDMLSFGDAEMIADPDGDWVKREDVEPLEQRVRDLEAAIRLHEESHLRYGDPSRRHDKRLWAALGGAGEG